MFYVSFTNYDFVLKYVTNPYNEFTESRYGYLEHFVPASGQIIVDAGAGIGGFTILLAKLIGEKGKIYALEPDPGTFEILKRNLALNDVNNVIPLDLGLWDKKTVLHFNAQSSATSMIVRDSEDPHQANSEIKVTSLDNLVQEYKISRIDLLKMDIEGAEIEALHGAKNCLKNKVVRESAIASYHIVDGKETSIYVEKVFSEAGYKSYSCNPIHKTTIAY